MLPLERQEMLREVKEKLPEWAPLDRCILVGLRGSDAHGTKLEDNPNSIDDIDVFAVVVQPMDFYLGLDGYGKKNQHWDSAGDHLDILVYDVRKFIHLLTKCNPNVVNWLHNRKEDYLKMDHNGEFLIENRDLFLSKEIFNRLIGYAYGQMKRMTADKKYEGYMGEKRKMLVDNYGYDVKNAAHCVRLMLMAIELAMKGNFSTYRPEHDRKIIKSIKAGEWDLDSVVSYTDSLMETFREVEAYSNLPDRVNRDMASDILTSVIYNFNDI